MNFVGGAILPPHKIFRERREKMILAIGNSGAYEVEAFKMVLKELEIKGKKVVFFEQDKCLNGEYLVFQTKNSRADYYIIVDGKEYNIDDFFSIWYLKPHLDDRLRKYQPIEYRQFINKQFWAMRSALWSIFKDKKWIDDPWSIQKAENKLYQLTCATKAGLKIPDTIVTSDPERIRKFFYEHNRNIIIKMLYASPIVDKVIYTNVVTEKQIKDTEKIRICPSIFQECIKKSYELRITVVGTEIFPVKIYSQEDPDTSLDWRKKPKLNDFEVKMEQTILPENIVKQIRDFMNILGLRFGCIDMIVNENNEYVFLEINPNGQWLFLQLRAEVQIAKAIANLLL